TKTCQILVEGEYSGVLEPDRHYIPLKRDFSNLDEVLDKLRDRHLVDEMVERAFNDIYLSGQYSYRAFAHQIEQALGAQNIQNGHRTTTVVRDTEKKSKTNEVSESLERQLAIERHNRALLEAKLLDARQHIGELTSQLQDIGELTSQLQVSSGEL